MGILSDSVKLLYSPRSAWKSIAESPSSLMSVVGMHTVPLALIPAVCWYFGVTQQGWQVAGESVKLTTSSALPICVLFYLATVYGVLFLGFMVHWMAKTYESESTIARGVTLISLAATPFFLAGALGLAPILWLDIVVAVVVMCYSIYLLYLGTPYVMRVAPERGFLYSSAVFAIALVMIVTLLTASVILWDLGPAPEYTYGN